MAPRDRTSHKKTNALANKWARAARPARNNFTPDATWYANKLKDPFLSPRDRRLYARELSALESTEHARAKVRAALACESAS